MPRHHISPLLATAHGNGPFYPVIYYNRRAYPVGGAFEQLADAVEQATLIAQTIRDDMRWKPEEQ
jgi:hypothetical protein